LKGLRMMAREVRAKERIETNQMHRLKKNVAAFMATQTYETRGEGGSSREYPWIGEGKGERKSSREIFRRKKKEVDKALPRRWIAVTSGRWGGRGKQKILVA